MKISVLLLAAGKGDRFFSGTPKQFHELGDKRVFEYSLELIESFDFDEVVVVTNEPSYFEGYRCTLGGGTRQESVKLGLEMVRSEKIIIFEAARPFVSPEIVKAHIEKLKAGAVCVNTCISASDTINICQNGKIKSIPKRKNFLIGQTPQSFDTALLKKAHATKKSYTDDCGLMLDAGFEVDYVWGSPENIKITHPGDLRVAEAFLAYRFA